MSWLRAQRWHHEHDNCTKLCHLTPIRWTHTSENKLNTHLCCSSPSLLISPPPPSCRISPGVVIKSNTMNTTAVHCLRTLLADNLYLLHTPVCILPPTQPPCTSTMSSIPTQNCIAPTPPPRNQPGHINPDVVIESYTMNITTVQGFDAFKASVTQPDDPNKSRVDLILSCVDNYEARITINQVRGCRGGVCLCWAGGEGWWWKGVEEHGRGEAGKGRAWAGGQAEGQSQSWPCLRSLHSLHASAAEFRVQGVL